ncbi:hypothetical protein [Pseudaquabacterium terrae]|nr:hypothetical protein [Aquabacterium terrae]
MHGSRSRLIVPTAATMPAHATEGEVAVILGGLLPIMGGSA